MKFLKNKSNKFLFAALCVLGFSCFLSVVHINSYVADKNNTNWLFTTLAVVFGLAALVVIREAIIRRMKNKKY